MARSIHRTKIGILVTLVAFTPATLLNNVYADIPGVTRDLTFQVDIDESLTVSVTDPTTWATGNINEFLRNKVNVSATTNNGVGVTVSMYTNNTNLLNLAKYSSTSDTPDTTKPTTYIPTLSESYTAADFPTNYWGYSIDDTNDGSTTANYNALTTTATQLFTTVGTSNISSGQKDVFFGAKANAEKQSGTYAQTVYFAAVTGTIDTDPTSPSYNPLKPENPSTPDPTSQIAHYSTTTGRTTYTTRTTTGTTSNPDPVVGSRSVTTTDVTEGDTTSGYANAAGVTTTTNNDSTLAAILAVSATVAVASGTAFIIAAKRRRDDEEEEQK